MVLPTFAFDNKSWLCSVWSASALCFLFNYPCGVLLFIHLIQCCGSEKVTLPTVEWKAFRAGHWKSLVLNRQLCLATTWLVSRWGMLCLEWRAEPWLCHYSHGQLARIHPICTNAPIIVLDIVLFKTHISSCTHFLTSVPHLGGNCPGSFCAFPRYWLCCWVPQLGEICYQFCSLH